MAQPTQRRPPTHPPTQRVVDGTCRAPHEQILEEEIGRLKLKWSRRTDVVPPKPTRLILIFRRLPFTIRYSTKLDKDSGCCESFEAAQSVEGVNECISGVWKLIKVADTIDYTQIFGPLYQVLIVGEPRVDMSKITSNGDAQERLKTRLKNFLAQSNIVPVFLSDRAHKERYSEELLYPLFHYRTPPIGTGFTHLDWPAYFESNLGFCNTATELYQQGDRFLIFSYHLMLLPQFIRQTPKTEDAFIFYFLPTVFPSSEMFRILPQRQELATGVLHSNVISFQAQQYRKHFMTVVTRILGVECGHYNVEPCMESGGTGVRVCVTPQGVPVPAWINAAQKINKLRLLEKFNGKKVILGVDTLDYTKGIPMKMIAFRKFLSEHPEWAKEVVLLQLCFLGNKSQGSANYRLSQADRKDILAQVFQVTGDINASFGSIDHLPVYFLVGEFPIEELASIYGGADIGLFTALRESINSSAYPFVICQQDTNKGILIMSEFSATCQQLSASVLPINPWDVQATADAIYSALTMPMEEREERHEVAYEIVTKMDGQSWGKQVLHEMEEALEEAMETKIAVPPPLPFHDCVEALCKYRHVILVSGIRESLLRTPPALLDQEAMYPQALMENYTNLPESDDEQEAVTPQASGATMVVEAASPPTLVASPFPAPSPTPLIMMMPRSTESDINLLSKNPRATVIIVSSSSTDVVAKVVEDCPAVWAFSENGHFYRRPMTKTFVPFESEEQGTPDSRSARSSEPDFVVESLSKVQSLVEYFARRTPGSYMRRTELSISWHYNNSDKRFASNQAHDLLFHLYAGPLLSNTQLELCIGRSSVEVRACAVTKSMAIEWVINHVCRSKGISPHEIGILCIGNYLPRDEDVYQTVTKIVTGGIKADTGSVKDTGIIKADTGVIKADTGTIKADTDENQRHTPGCYTCTIGVRLSKALYRIDTNERIRALIRNLAEALQIAEPPRLPDELQFPTAVTNHPSVPSPSLDVAFMLSSATPSSHNQPGEYYRYLPAGRGGETNRSVAHIPTDTREQSDIEEDASDDAEELFVLTAGAALNLPNGIPFTHARPHHRAEGWARTVPNLMPVPTIDVVSVPNTARDDIFVTPESPDTYSPHTRS